MTRQSAIIATLTGVALTTVICTALILRPDASTAAEQAAAPAGRMVMVAAPTVQRTVDWDEYSGRFAAIDDVEIRARVSGYLTEVAFTDGEIVDAGDLLFRIDPRPFEAALAAANATLAHTEAAFRYAKAESERGQQLVNQHALSNEEGERRLRELQQAEADRAAARARVAQAELDLEFTEVRAPVSGRVSDNFVSVGNLIVGGANGGTLLTTLVSLDPIYFEFTASEADYLKYRRLEQLGTRQSGRDTHHPVHVKLMDEDSFGHSGHLSFVDNRLDHSTGTMRGRATLDNPDGIFAPGMFGRLQLLGSGEYDAVLIPDTAVQTDQAQKFVWVATTDDTAARRVVKLGPELNGLRIVREGLDKNDRVIVSGTQFVRDGTPVIPQPLEPQQKLTVR
ncbi:MAG: efflux RND transporter periplasmic adaptor subunit [Halioglobus sp.]|nr:efflux RND transporter periplasmic adaptor subunit [Halioglobus sp.]